MAEAGEVGDAVLRRETGEDFRVEQVGVRDRPGEAHQGERVDAIPCE